MRLHHVQLACPPGGEDAARGFWVDGMGLVEVAKPVALAGRGGAWFRAHGPGGEVVLEVHVGVEEGMVPARKAHPGLLLDTPSDLAELATRLEAAGHEVDRREADTFPGYHRWHTADAHGNRIEVLAPSVR